MEDDLVIQTFDQFGMQLKNRVRSVLPAEAIDEDPAVAFGRIGRDGPHTTQPSSKYLALYAPRLSPNQRIYRLDFS